MSRGIALRSSKSLVRPKPAERSKASVRSDRLNSPADPWLRSPEGSAGVGSKVSGWIPFGSEWKALGIQLEVQ